MQMLVHGELFLLEIAYRSLVQQSCAEPCRALSGIPIGVATGPSLSVVPAWFPMTNCAASPTRKDVSIRIKSTHQQHWFHAMRLPILALSPSGSCQIHRRPLQWTHPGCTSTNPVVVVARSSSLLFS